MTLSLLAWTMVAWIIVYVWFCVELFDLHWQTMRLRLVVAIGFAAIGLLALKMGWYDGMVFTPYVALAFNVISLFLPPQNGRRKEGDQKSVQIIADFDLWTLFWQLNDGLPAIIPASANRNSKPMPALKVIEKGKETL